MQKLQRMKEAFLMAKHMFIIEAHSGSFLSIFKADPNKSNAYITG